MPFYAVLQYQADWNSKLNKYQIQIRCQGNPQAFKVAINTEAEYASVLMMLGRSNVTYDPVSGDFQLGPRPAGT